MKPKLTSIAILVIALSFPLDAAGAASPVDVSMVSQVDNVTKWLSGDRTTSGSASANESASSVWSFSGCVLAGSKNGFTFTSLSDKNCIIYRADGIEGISKFPIAIIVNTVTGKFISLSEERRGLFVPLDKERHEIIKPFLDETLASMPKP